MTTTMKANAWCGFLQLLLIVKGCLSIYIEVLPKEALVLPNQNFTVMCRVSVPIQYCRMDVPGNGVTLNLNQNMAQSKDFSYFGSGLDKGQCGLLINNVQERNNGEIKCSLGTFTEVQESSAITHLTVAKSPKAPQLQIFKDHDHYWAYKIGDHLRATCSVRDARPVANITWFLDDEPVPTHYLSAPTITTSADSELYTIIQNITKELGPSDNGRDLKCVSSHPTSNENNLAFRQLNVTYPPIAQINPIDKFGYVLGKDGVITLEIEANPKPHVEWHVRDQVIKERGHDNTGRIKAEEVEDLGRGRYAATLVIANINKQDTETQYILKAYNDMGPQDYTILISTSAEPEDLELGVSAIIGIVVSVLVLLLIVFLVIFARVTGRWCFSGSTTTVRNIGESSDTESVEVRPKDGRKLFLPSLKLASIFKRGTKSDEEADEERPRSAETVETKIPIDDADKTPSSSEPKNNEGGIVYAELDLVNPAGKAMVKPDDDKTEYAEIVYSQKDGEEAEDKKKSDSHQKS